MKYLKPELLTQLRSLNDAAAETAAEEWELALKMYRTRLRAIRQRLPRAVRRLHARFSLHDAQIIAITFGRDEPRLTLLLRLEGTSSQPGQVLELGYLLVAGRYGGVSFKNHQPSDNGQGRAWILYDEFDLDEERAFFTHSLLLADGKEIDIRFQHLQLRMLETVLLSPLDFSVAEKTWPLVEA